MQRAEQIRAADAAVTFLSTQYDVSVKIPGSAVSFRSKRQKSATELDFIAEARDAGAASFRLSAIPSA
jgi:hypothetical protein